MLHRHFTLKQFRYFLAVAESGSVAAAARMVNIAQSAVTKSIMEVEATLGAALFTRSVHGMTLTQAGHRFETSARKVISAVAEAGMIDRAHTQSLSGTLNIGVTSLVAGYYLADLFARFQRSHPSVRLNVVEDSPQFLEHLLVGGEVDLAIMITNALGDPQALVVEQLTRSPIRVWLSPSHPLVEKSDLSLADCAAVPQIVLQADRVEAVMRPVWSRHGFNPDVVLRTSSLEAVRSLVGVGAGICVLPDFLYRPWTLDNEHVEVRSLRDAVPTVDVGVVWRRSTNTQVVVQEFIMTAREKSGTRR